ncbi:MAG: hypothetical protein WBL02_00175 [Methanomethylovorans sp.]|uniref:hypothetical protein n=1 Tax=Methanomethylovorans sp. TaxID=2758717 RepID=UPI003C7859EB
MQEKKIGATHKVLRFIVSFFPLFIIAMVAAGIAIAYFIDRPDFAIRGLLVAVPAIFSAIFLSKMFRKDVCHDELLLKRPSLSQRTMILAFITFYLLSIIFLFLSTTRTGYYFGTVTLAYILVLNQIFSRSSKPYIILLELFLLSLNLIYSVTLKYPLYFGGTDIMSHLFISEVTYLSGHVAPADLSTFYASFPLFHIFNSELAYLLGMDLQTAYFFGSGLVYSVLLIFIYYFFMKATKNSTFSLLSCLVYSVSGTVIYYGMYMITRTLAYAGLIVILYLLYKKDENNRGFAYQGLAILLTIFLVIVHQVSAAQIAVILFLLLVCEHILSNENYINTTYFSLFCTMFMGYWFYFANVFVEELLLSRSDVHFYEEFQIKETVQMGYEWIYILNHLDVSIFLFFALIGIGYLLWDRIKSNKRNYVDYFSVFALFALLTLVLYIPTPIQTLWQTMTLFRFDRFMLLISPFMAFAMAAGIYILYSHLSDSGKRPSWMIAISVLMAIFVLTSIYYNGPESKPILTYPVREYFTSDEIQGFNYFMDHVDPGSELHSDYHAHRFFIQQNFSKSEELGLPFFRSYTISKVDEIPNYKGYVLIRQKQFMDGGIYTGSGSSNFLYGPEDGKDAVLLNSLSKDAKIYSNYGVDLYL